MRHSTPCTVKPLAMRLDRSSCQNLLPPPIRRKTQWTKHYKRAPSMISADLDIALKEFTLLPKPLTALTNHRHSNKEECYISVERLEKECLFLPNMSEATAPSDEPAITLKPLHRHATAADDHAAPNVRTRTDKHDAPPAVDNRTLLLTPKTPTQPQRYFSTPPPAPRKQRKLSNFIELDEATAPASIFLPEDI